MSERKSDQDPDREKKTKKAKPTSVDEVEVTEITPDGERRIRKVSRYILHGRLKP